MQNLPLLQDGKVQNFWGLTRLCQYINVPTTGEYDTIICENPGTMTLDEMKKQVKKTGRPVLMPVLFSGMEIDVLSGDFGGEMRLAYLYDGKSVKAVTGGSINGNIIEAQKTIRFSKERQRFFTTDTAFGGINFEGPLAALFENISVAGL